MPLITLPMDPEGLVMPAAVSLPLDTIRFLQQTGTVVPPPVAVRAILDSAADVTIISPRLIAHFGLLPEHHLSNRTIDGTTTVLVYAVALILHGLEGTTGPVLVREPHPVLGAPQPFSQTIDVIVGLDILLDCLLVSNGPARTFSLAF